MLETMATTKSMEKLKIARYKTVLLTSMPRVRVEYPPTLLQQKLLTVQATAVGLSSSASTDICASIQGTVDFVNKSRLGV